MIQLDSDYLGNTNIIATLWCYSAFYIFHQMLQIITVLTFQQNKTLL